MTVYVESNFVLEQALQQEEYDSCDRLVDLASAGRITLVVPAFSLAEPYEALSRKQKARSRLGHDLQAHLFDLGRSRPYRNVPASFGDLAEVLIHSGQLEREELQRTVTTLLSTAEVIALDADVLRSAVAMQLHHRLSGQDAIVFASVVAHLEQRRPAESCFLSRNSRDFDDTEVRGKLRTFGCTFFGHFDQALRYITTRV